MRILKRFICNLGCVHIRLLCLILPVYKWVLLMSPFTWDLCLGGWGWWAMLYYFCTCFRAVASPTKLSCTQRTRVNFPRLFMMVWCHFSCLCGLFDFSQNLVSWYSENIFYLFCFQVGVMSGWVSWWFWWSVTLISENLKGCWHLWRQDSMYVL